MRCKIAKKNNSCIVLADLKSRNPHPYGPRNALFSSISVIPHCINLVVAVFPYICGHFPDKHSKGLSLFLHPKNFYKFNAAISILLIGEKQLQIKMFDDRITVESPGILPGIVRLNNLRTVHFSRSPNIARFLREYDYVQEFGMG